MKAVITNRTRRLGWGYNCSPSQGERGYYFEPPEKPDFTGTIRQIRDAADADRTYQSIQSGGTFYSYAWFYKGRRIVKADGYKGSNMLDYLLGMALVGDFEIHIETEV